MRTILINQTKDGATTVRAERLFKRFALKLSLRIWLTSSRRNPQEQTNLPCLTFEHNIMTNFCAGKSKNEEVSHVAQQRIGLRDQRHMLRPTVTVMHCITGSIMDEISGTGAKKRMARRRLDMVNTNIHTFIMVCVSRVEFRRAIAQDAGTKEVSGLAAGLAEIQADKKTAEKDKQLENKKQKEAHQHRKDIQISKKKDAERKEGFGGKTIGLCL
jgi:hypothetical protein